MINFKNIRIEDRELFSLFLSNSEPETSELTFTNLFMWRHYYNINYEIINDLLFVVSSGSATIEPFAFFPLGQTTNSNLASAIEKLKSYFTQNSWRLKFKRVSGAQIDQLKASGCLDIKAQRDPDNDDYLYNSADLIHFKGRKYSDKRNHINKFNREHFFEYVSLTPELTFIGKSIIEKWLSLNYRENQKAVLNEKNANFELLNHYSDLGCKGALFLVDGSFEALFIGEMLNSSTAVIHLEKANREIKGLYTFCTQQFCLREWAHTSYINLEQDLGIPGLRQSKRSYNPCKIIEKYIVEL